MGRWQLGPNHPDMQLRSPLIPEGVGTVSRATLACAHPSAPASSGSFDPPAPHGKRPPLSLEHRIAIGASAIGIMPDEYRSHVKAGEKWCAGHHAWHPRTAEVFYTRPATRDGLDNACKDIVRVRAREAMRRARDGQGREEAV
jgi:hypothetical protein